MRSVTIRQFVAAGLVTTLAAALGAPAEACHMRRSSACGGHHGLFGGMRHRHCAAPAPCAPVAYEQVAYEPAYGAQPSGQGWYPSGQTAAPAAVAPAPAAGTDVAPPAPAVPAGAETAPPPAPSAAPAPPAVPGTPAAPAAAPAPPAVPTLPAAPAVPAAPPAPAVPGVPK